MDKCREAFERHQADLSNMQYEELKALLDEYQRHSGVRYNSFNDFEDDWNIWKACWQSRQTEVDQLNQLYLKAQHQEVRHRTIAQDALAEIEEKEKRIEELESALKKINENLDLHDCESCWEHWIEIEKVLPEALRGEHES